MAEAILANVNQDKLKASLRFLDKQGEMTVETLKVNGQDVSKAEKLEELFKDEDFVKELAPTSNAAEAQAVFAAHGLELTAEEVKGISQQCAGCIKKLEENDGELSENDLEQICGGASGSDIAGSMTGAGIAFAIGGALIGNIICPGIGTAIGAVIGGIVGAGIGAAISFFSGLFD